MQIPSLHITDTNTITTTFELWIETLQARRLASRTIETYSDSVGGFVAFLCQQGCHHLEDVQPHHIRRWLIHKQAHAVSTHTLHNAYRLPRTFWNWCIREGLTEHNPFAKVEPPKREQKLKPALQPEQVEAILQACEGKHWLRLRDKALILLLLDTGVRIHECHQLRVCDVAQNALILRGKGGKQRVVVLSAEVRLAIQRYLKACPAKPAGEQPLWHGIDGALT